MASAWGVSWGVAWGNSWGIAVEPSVPPIDTGGAGGIHSIQSKTSRRSPRYRSYRFTEDTPVAEIREAAQELRSEARKSPLSETVEDDSAALAQVYQSLSHIGRLAGVLAELDRAIEFATAQRIKAEAARREQDQDEDDAATLLLIH